MKKLFDFETMKVGYYLIKKIDKLQKKYYFLGEETDGVYIILKSQLNKNRELLRQLKKDNFVEINDKFVSLVSPSDVKIAIREEINNT